MTAKKMPRLFIALELPPETKSALSALKNDFQGLEKQKWVSGENIHLTLKFLGETENEKLPGIKQKLDEAAARNKKFEIELNGKGTFPVPARARVFFIKLAKGAENCIKLAEEIEVSMAQIGFQQEERKFKPHITLARFKYPVNLQNEMSKCPEGAVFSKISIKDVTLFKSTLTPAGPVYERLHVSKLS